MIIQQFNSGLGNQMFQYVFFRQLQKHHPEVRVKADLTWFDWNQVHQGYELERLFGIHLPKADPWEIALASGQFPHTVKGYRYINRILRIFDKGYIGRHVRDEMSPDDMISYDTGRHLYATGFYISERYYRDNLEEIRDVFAFPESELESSSVMVHNIRSVTGVSVHVRRGDYLDPIYKDRNHPSVKKLTDIWSRHMDKFTDFKEEYREQFTEAIAIGGGTYARHIPNTIAFGTQTPWIEDRCHQANESVAVNDFIEWVNIIKEYIETA